MPKSAPSAPRSKRGSCPAFETAKEELQSTNEELTTVNEELHSRNQAMLDPGQHVVHELLSGRSAWLHVVKGEVTLGDITLTPGDGAGISAERAVSFTARGQTEVLLVDVRQAVIADIAVGAPASAPSN